MHEGVISGHTNAPFTEGVLQVRSWCPGTSASSAPLWKYNTMSINMYVYLHVYTHIPAYWITRMAERRSGRNIHIPIPAYQICTNGRSPVREKYTHPSLPTRSAQMADRRSGRNIHIPIPAYQICTNGRSPVREKYTHPSLPTRSHEWQIAGQGEIYTYPSLPSRSHEWQIAGQGEIYTYPSLPTRSARMADRRSGRNIHIPIPAYQICTNGRSPVREKYTHTHPCLSDLHEWQIAGQGEIYTRHAVAGIHCTHIHTYLRAPCTVEVHFPLCSGSGSGRLDHYTITAAYSANICRLCATTF